MLLLICIIFCVYIEETFFIWRKNYGEKHKKKKTNSKHITCFHFLAVKKITRVNFFAVTNRTRNKRVNIDFIKN